jgi:biotin carboxyl carrier protein
MKVISQVNEVILEVDITVDLEREQRFVAKLPEGDAHLEVIEAKPGSLTLSIDGRVGFYEFDQERGRIVGVVHNNRTYRTALKTRQQGQLEQLLEEFGAGLGGSASETVLAAPMPGKILRVAVTAGDEVQLGQVVLVLEAMKMENEISSTVEGKVKEVKVDVGDSVNTGDALLDVEPRR